MSSTGISLVTILFFSFYVINIRLDDKTARKLFTYVLNKQKKIYELSKILSIKVLFIVFASSYYFIENFLALFLINIIVLFFLINIGNVARYANFIKKIAVKENFSQTNLNKIILNIIDKNLTLYFSIFFYFIVGGAPVAILYIYLFLNWKERGTNEYLLYIPVRILWLLIVLIHIIYSQDYDVIAKLNWKERYNKTSLNGSWIESIVAGILGIQLTLKSFSHDICVGENKRDISVKDVIIIFNILTFIPFLFVLLEVL